MSGGEAPGAGEVGPGVGVQGRAGDTADVFTVSPEQSSAQQAEVVQQRVVSDLIVLRGGKSARHGSEKARNDRVDAPDEREGVPLTV